MAVNLTQILHEILKDDFKLKNQNEIANALGIQQSQLSNYLKGKNAGKRVVKKMIISFGETYAQKKQYTKVNLVKVIVSVTEKRFNAKTQKEQAEVLGIRQPQLSNYVNNNNAGDKAIEKMLNHLIKKVEEKTTRQIISP